MNLWSSLFGEQSRPCQHMDKYRPPSLPSAHKHARTRRDEDTFYASRRLTAHYKVGELAGEVGEQVAKELWCKVQIIYHICLNSTLQMHLVC